MGYSKPYSLMVVLIFLISVKDTFAAGEYKIKRPLYALQEARTCAYEISAEFRRNSNFYHCYDFAYHELTESALKNLNYPRRVDQPCNTYDDDYESYPLSYMRYIYSKIDKEEVISGYDYCKDASRKETCEQELENNNFPMNDPKAAFTYAFKEIKKDNIPKEDTYAVGYFEDIFSRAGLGSVIVNIYTPSEWCDILLVSDEV